MCKYIILPWGMIYAYDLFINIGTVLAVVILSKLIYRQLHSIPGTVKMTFSMFLMVIAGVVPAGVIASMASWKIKGIMDFFMLFVEPSSTHFIGRVLFCIWIYPVVFRCFLKKYNEKKESCMDAFCLVLTVQHFFNRTACLFNGCCYGAYYKGFLALQYHSGVGEGGGYDYPVYPTQLFEMVCMILLFAVSTYLYRKGKEVKGWFCLGFGITIFVSELMKDKTGMIYILGINIIQYAAILLIVTGLYKVYCGYRKERR